MELQDGFLSWLGARAPASLGDYARYYKRYRGLLEGLELSRLPCNSWVLKLAGSYIEYLLYTSSVDLETYARLRLELRLRWRACSVAKPRRGVGVERCPSSIPRLRGPVYWVWRALLESGVRAKHLWLLWGRRPETVEGALVWDLRLPGTKRVNTVILSPETAARAILVVERWSYRTIKDYSHRLGAPVSCPRKIHWNVCIALADRSLCGFIQGRWAPVDIVHYEMWKLEAAKVSKRIWRVTGKALEGYTLKELLALVDNLKYNPPLSRVEAGEQHVARLNPQGPGEPGGDGNADIVSILSAYSNRLG